MNFRYPGSSSFDDTEIDRSIFKGRERESELLYYQILSQQIVVLFGKSGIGKTSLLKASVFEMLRKEEYLPIIIRVNKGKNNTNKLNKRKKETPFDLLYYCIDSFIKNNNDIILKKTKSTKCIWEYFLFNKFFRGKKELIPILVFDQFEHFFDFHSKDQRNNFINQLSYLLSGRIPEEYKNKNINKLPKVKIIISIRDDYLGYLDEISYYIPSILNNRFRLLPLNSEQAKKAIEEPAKLKNTSFQSMPFEFDEDAVNEILNFLRPTKYNNEIKLTDEIEPFELQLLCHYIEENKVPKQNDKKYGKNDNIIIEKNVLGGKKGMQKILQDDYDNKLKKLDSFFQKIRSKKLIEKGLISSSNKRLSIAEEQIKDDYKVYPDTLSKLVEHRLLRVDHRLNSSYYELSHDTLIGPIRNSQRKAINKKMSFIFIISIIPFILLMFLIISFISDRYSSNKFNNLMKVGKVYFNNNDYDNAKEIFLEVIFLKNNDYKLGEAYYMLGNVYFEEGESESAKFTFKKCVDINPNYAKEIGDKFYNKNILDEAANYYKIANEQDPNYDKEIGDKFYNKNQYDIAEKYYIEYIKEVIDKASNKEIEKKYVDMYFNLGNIYLVKKDNIQNNYNEAIKYYKKTINLDPNYSIQIGNKLFNIGKYEESLNYYKIAEKENSTYFDTYVYYNMGKIFNYNNENNTAKKYYEKAIQLDDNNINALKELADLYILDRNYKTAKAYYNRVVKNSDKYTLEIGKKFYENHKYKDSLDFLLRIINNKNVSAAVSADAYCTLGNVYYKLNDSQAEICYKKALDKDNGNYNAIFGLGDFYFSKKDYKKAIQYYKKANDIEKNDIEILMKLGDTYYLKKEYEDSIDYYKKAIDIDPNYTYAYNNLGNVYYDQKNYEEAIKNYKKVVEIDPNNASAYYWIGYISFLQNIDNEADINFKKAIDLDPNYAKEIGDKFNNDSKYEEAEFFYKKAIEFNSNNVDVYNDLGIIYYNWGRYKEAEKKYKEAIEIDNNYKYAYYNLGLLYYNQKNYEEAIKYYEKAIDKDINFSYVFRNLGLCYENLKKYEVAEDKYKKALEIDSNFIEVYNDLGILYYKWGKYKEAEYEYKKAINIDKKYKYAYYNLGLLYSNEDNIDKNYENAIKNYKEVIEIDNNYYQAYYKLGIILFDQQKDYINANINYKNAFNISPNDNYIKMSYAESCLTIEEYEEANKLSNEVLLLNTISLKDKLVLRYIIITSLIFQDNIKEAYSKIVEFIGYYKTLPADFSPGIWKYDGIKYFIKKTNKLNSIEKDIIFKIIEILESSKVNANEKISELESLIM